MKLLKHIIVVLLSALCCLLALSACHSNHDSGDEPVSDDMVIMMLDMDWSDLEEKPTGMTMLFYPSDGGLPIMRLSNRVDHYECTLPDDDYSVLVFNQTEQEYASLKFRNLENLDLAEVYAVTDPSPVDRIDRLYNLSIAQTRAKVASLRLKKNLASAVSRSKTRAKVKSLALKARPNLSRMTVSVRVKGMTYTRAAEHEVMAVNGALTGLAAGYFLGLEKLTPESLTQELDEWEIEYATSPDGIGAVRTEFAVFGISPLIRTTGTALTEEDTENILYLNFRLRNGTYVSYRFLVTDRIIEHVVGMDLSLELNIGVEVPGVTDDLNEPLVLPDVGLPYGGGLQPEVMEWKEPVQQEVTLQ